MSDLLRPVPPRCSSAEPLELQGSGLPVELLSVVGETRRGDAVVDTVTLPGLLLRFAPTPQQRQAIAAGEDLFLALVLEQESAPPVGIELQVGPGDYQVVSPILGADGEPAQRARPALAIVPP